MNNVPRNVWRDSPECLGTLPGMFEDIARNVWGHSPECLATFPGMFANIPRNVWRHSFPTGQFNLPGFRTPYRKDLPVKSRGLLFM